jgi:hypothetical protein
LWTYGAEGELLVAHSVRGAVIGPSPLPEDLRAMLDTSKSRVRERGVAELADLLDTADPGLIVSARQALEQITGQDIPRVASLARTALLAPPGTAAEHVHHELAGRARLEKEARAKEQKEAAEQPIRTITVEEPVTREGVLPKEQPPGPPAPSPIPKPSPSWATWSRVLVSRVRFWFGLVLVLAGAIPLLMNVQHYYGYEKYPSVANLHLYIELGLSVLIIAGVLLAGSAAISAVAVPRDRR